MRVVCPKCLSVNNVPKQESYKKANCGKCKASLLNTKPISLNKQSFGVFVANSDLPIIIDFWAPWCGPCKMMAPNFHRSAENYPMQVIYAKVNTEEEPQIASRFNIRSIPTLIVFKNGSEVSRTTGALDVASLNKLASKFA